MQKIRKYICTGILLFSISMQVFWWNGINVCAEPAAIEAPSAVLLESSTGKVIFEQNARERRSPASITKIMTLLLTFEALDQGKIKLEDPVTVSAYASSMGGSQVFLAENEVQTLETLIKCIAVASGNDASVAVAEYIAGRSFRGTDECEGVGAWHDGYSFRGLLWPDGFRRPLYDGNGRSGHVEGAYGKISENI